jgi:hypothetical protein
MAAQQRLQQHAQTSDIVRTAQGSQAEEIDDGLPAYRGADGQRPPIRGLI